MGTKTLRSEKVGDSLSQNSDGIWVGKYNDYILNCAYQPIVRHLDNGNFGEYGFEGLVRPIGKTGLMAPVKFFDSILHEDQLFIECMCQALHIRNFKLSIPRHQTLFININANAYKDIAMVDKEFEYLFGAFDRNNIDREKFVFEIVETEAHEPLIFNRLVESVRSLGVKLAMDDFGKDASNFERFILLNPEIVKLDRDIFKSLSSNSKSRQLLRTLVTRFHDMNSKVLVEGLENAQDLEIALEFLY